MQKKRRIWVIAGILIILIIAISFLWIFYKPKDEKVLPHANEITDWKQYSSDELNSIFSKSGLRETEQLLITLSEEEKKELVEKCPYLKEEGTVLVNYNGDDGYTHVYSSSILKEADTYKKEAVEQNRKKYLEQKQEKGELTESEASELSTFATVPDNAGSLSLERYISQLYGDQYQLTSLTTICYMSFTTFTNNKSIVSSKDYSTAIKDIPGKYRVKELMGDLTDKQIYKEVQEASRNAYLTLNITLAEKSFYQKKVPIEKIAVTFPSDTYKNFYGFSSSINYQKKTTLANGPLCSVSGHHGTSDGASIVVIEGLKYFLPTGCYPISTKQFNDGLGRFNFLTYPKLVDCTKTSSYFKQCELIDTQKQTFGLKNRDEKYDTDSEMFYKKGHMTFVSDTIDIQINIGTETSEGLGRQLYDKWFKVNKDCNTFEKIYKQVSWYEDEEERRDAAQTLLNLFFGDNPWRIATCRTIALVHNFEALKLDLGGGVIKDENAKDGKNIIDYSIKKDGVYKYDDLADNVLFDDEDNYLYMNLKAAGLDETLEKDTTTDELAYQTSDTQLRLSMKYLKTQLFGTEGLSALDKLDIRTNVVRRGYLLNKVTLDKASTNAVGVLYKGKYYVGDNSDKSNEYKISKTDGYAKSFLLYKSTDDAAGLIGDIDSNYTDYNPDSFDLTKYTYAYGSNLENYSEDTAENKKIYSAITFHWKNTAPKINPGNADTSSFNPTTATDKTLYKTGTYDEKYNEYKVVINADEYAGKTYSEILKDVLKNAQVTVTDKEDEANSTSADKLKLNPDIPTLDDYGIADLSKYDMSTCEHADELFIKISNSSVKGTDDLCSNATEKSLLTDATCETIELRVHDFSQEKDGYDKCKIYVYVYGNGVIKTPSPTPTGGVDVTSAPSQNISASVTRHTSHKLTEAEILAICPILPPQTEQTAPPDTYTQTSQSYQEDNRKVVETELLNKRLSPGTYTIHVDTTYTITYNWKHNHISDCACPGHPHTDKDGNVYYTSCGSYCRCRYSAEKTTQQQYHSHNLNKDTYVTITIVNCDPKIEIAKKTVNRTEADTINWGIITEGISEIKDHEDMSIHSGVGVTCGVCAGTEIDYTIWKNISNAMNATETTGKIKFEKKPIERSGIGKEKAEITIDIGKLRLNQQNPGGKYPVKIEVTDSDGATTKNGLIYHTNEIISQLDFYTTNVLKVTDVLNVM